MGGEGPHLHIVWEEKQDEGRVGKEEQKSDLYFSMFGYNSFYLCTKNALFLLYFRYITVYSGQIDPLSMGQFDPNTIKGINVAFCEIFSKGHE